MTLFRKTTRFYSDEYELRGLVNALGNKVSDENLIKAQPYYLGALTAINILASSEELRDQMAFMAIFDQTLRNEGILEQGKGVYNHA